MKILTFDIEDWFHLLDNKATQSVDSWNNYSSRLNGGVERILDLLETTNQKATFFILGWVAEKYPKVIKKIDSYGHEIASHSYAHQLVYKQSKKEFKDDLYKSKVILEDLIAKSVVAYRAPGFSITSKEYWAFETLVEMGFEIDCSVFPANRAHGGMPNFQSIAPCITEDFGKPLKFFPINTQTIFGKSFIYSGGGYFRLFPKFLLRHWFAKDDYVMTYFHPRDFDPDQPIVPGLTKVRKFKSYVGLGTALNKLRTIILENDFMSLSQADSLIDWNNVNKVKFNQV